MASLETLGSLAPEATAKLKAAKLLIIVRGSEVWIDPSDKDKAMEILKTVKVISEQVYRFHGFTVKMPREIKLDQKWYGFPCDETGGTGHISIMEFSKPINGVNTVDRAKGISRLLIKKQEIAIKTSIFSPAYSGIVMCDDEGTPIFEVTPYNIFVLFDPRVSLDGTKKVYEHMLMFAIVLANHQDELSRKVYDDIWSQQAPEREKFEIKQFEEMLIGSIRKQESTLAKAVTNHESEIRNYQQALFNSSRAMMEATVKLDAVKIILSSGMEAKAKEEWEKLKALERHKAVRNLKVTSEYLSFVTRMISWDPGKKWTLKYDGEEPLSGEHPIQLGEFNVSVNMGAIFSVKISNETRTLSYNGDRWHHPHVREGGICYGNMTESLPTFAARRDFEAIIMCMLKWLENVATTDTWGKGIYYWAKEDLKRREKEQKEIEKAEQAKQAAEEKAAKVELQEGETKPESPPEEKPREPEKVIVAAEADDEDYEE